jgi:IS5 family transposase
MPRATSAWHKLNPFTRISPTLRGNGRAGRKPYDTILKFKIVVLPLHNLSDEQSEYLIRDRISFMRFLDLELEDPVPDATTIWLFREALAEAGLIDKLFERFGQHLETEGYIARGGQLKQRNTKEENEAIKAGKTPEGWEKQPAKNAQKDKDARWTKKNDESFYGYKNHVGVDKAHVASAMPIISATSLTDLDRPRTSVPGRTSRHRKESARR